MSSPVRTTRARTHTQQSVVSLHVRRGARPPRSVLWDRRGGFTSLLARVATTWDVSPQALRKIELVGVEEITEANAHTLSDESELMALFEGDCLEDIKIEEDVANVPSVHVFTRGGETEYDLPTALGEFIDNAIQYGLELGSVNVIIRLETPPASSDCVLVVEDQGVGMSMEELRGWAVLGDTPSQSQTGRIAMYRALPHYRHLVGTFSKFGIGGKFSGMNIGNKIKAVSTKAGSDWQNSVLLDAGEMEKRGRWIRREEHRPLANAQEHSTRVEIRELRNTYRVLLQSNDTRPLACSIEQMYHYYLHGPLGYCDDKKNQILRTRVTKTLRDCYFKKNDPIEHEFTRDVEYMTSLLQETSILQADQENMFVVFCPVLSDNQHKALRDYFQTYSKELHPFLSNHMACINKGGGIPVDDGAPTIGTLRMLFGADSPGPFTFPLCRREHSLCFTISAPPCSGTRFVVVAENPSTSREHGLFVSFSPTLVQRWHSNVTSILFIAIDRPLYLFYPSMSVDVLGHDLARLPSVSEKLYTTSASQFRFEIEVPAKSDGTGMAFVEGIAFYFPQKFLNNALVESNPDNSVPYKKVDTFWNGRLVPRADVVLTFMERGKARKPPIECFSLRLKVHLFVGEEVAVTRNKLQFPANDDFFDRLNRACEKCDGLRNSFMGWIRWCNDNLEEVATFPQRPVRCEEGRSLFFSTTIRGHQEIVWGTKVQERTTTIRRPKQGWVVGIFHPGRPDPLRKTGKVMVLVWDVFVNTSVVDRKLEQRRQQQKNAAEDQAPPPLAMFRPPRDLARVASDDAKEAQIEEWDLLALDVMDDTEFEKRVQEGRKSTVKCLMMTAEPGPMPRCQSVCLFCLQFLPQGDSAEINRCGTCGIFCHTTCAGAPDNGSWECPDCKGKFIKENIRVRANEPFPVKPQLLNYCGEEIPTTGRKGLKMTLNVEKDGASVMQKSISLSQQRGRLAEFEFEGLPWPGVYEIKGSVVVGGKAIPCDPLAVKVLCGYPSLMRISSKTVEEVQIGSPFSIFLEFSHVSNASPSYGPSAGSRVSLWAREERHPPIDVKITPPSGVEISDHQLPQVKAGLLELAGLQVISALRSCLREPVVTKLMVAHPSFAADFPMRIIPGPPHHLLVDGVPSQVENHTSLPPLPIRIVDESGLPANIGSGTFVLALQSECLTPHSPLPVDVPRETGEAVLQWDTAPQFTAKFPIADTEYKEAELVVTLHERRGTHRRALLQEKICVKVIPSPAPHSVNINVRSEDRMMKREHTRENEIRIAAVVSSKIRFAVSLRNELGHDVSIPCNTVITWSWDSEEPPPTDKIVVAKTQNEIVFTVALPHPASPLPPVSVSLVPQAGDPFELCPLKSISVASGESVKILQWQFRDQNCNPIRSDSEALQQWKKEDVLAEVRLSSSTDCVVHRSQRAPVIVSGPGGHALLTFKGVVIAGTESTKEIALVWPLWTDKGLSIAKVIVTISHGMPHSLMVLQNDLEAAEISIPNIGLLPRLEVRVVDGSEFHNLCHKFKGRLQIEGPGILAQTHVEFTGGRAHVSDVACNVMEDLEDLEEMGFHQPILTFTVPTTGRTSLKLQRNVRYCRVNAVTALQFEATAPPLELVVGQELPPLQIRVVTEDGQPFALPNSLSAMITMADEEALVASCTDVRAEGRVSLARLEVPKGTRLERAGVWTITLRYNETRPSLQKRGAPQVELGTLRVVEGPPVRVIVAGDGWHDRISLSTEDFTFPAISVRVVDSFGNIVRSSSGGNHLVEIRVEPPGVVLRQCPLVHGEAWIRDLAIDPSRCVELGEHHLIVQPQWGTLEVVPQYLTFDFTANVNLHRMQKEATKVAQVLETLKKEREKLCASDLQHRKLEKEIGVALEKMHIHCPPAEWKRAIAHGKEELRKAFPLQGPSRRTKFREVDVMERFGESIASRSTFRQQRILAVPEERNTNTTFLPTVVGCTWDMIFVEDARHAWLLGHVCDEAGRRLRSIIVMSYRRAKEEITLDDWGSIERHRLDIMPLDTMDTFDLRGRPSFDDAFPWDYLLPACCRTGGHQHVNVRDYGFIEFAVNMPSLPRGYENLRKSVLWNIFHRTMVFKTLDHAFRFRTAVSHLRDRCPKLVALDGKTITDYGVVQPYEHKGDPPVTPGSRPPWVDQIEDLKRGLNRFSELDAKVKDYQQSREAHSSQRHNMERVEQSIRKTEARRTELNKEIEAAAAQRKRSTNDTPTPSKRARR